VRSLRFALAGAAVLVEATVAIALIFTSSHNDNPWLTTAVAVTAGPSFVAAGLVALWRRPENATGFLLAATGYLWFLGALSESNNSWVWTVGFVTGNFAFLAFAALVLAYPDGALGRRARWLIVVAGLAATGANAVSALVDETPARGCPNCPPSAIAIADRPGLADAVTIAATTIIVLALLAIFAILGGRWRRASPGRKRTLRPVFAACSIALSLLLTAVLVDRVDSRSYSVVWVLFLAAFSTVPLSFLAGVLRSRLDRAAAARMLVSLDAGVQLRDALAEALHDPSLEIVYRLDDRGRWVDADGRVVGEPAASPRRSTTAIERDGRTVAVLLHDPTLDAEPELVDFIVAGAGLSLDNVRLQADLRAQFLMLETVANTAPSLLVVVDTEGRILTLNRATLEASGVDDEKLILGSHFWEVFIDPADRAEMVQQFHEAAPDFTAAPYENTFTNARGEQLVIEWRSAPITDASGRVTSIVAGGIDITERKHRELQLQRERDITETLMQSIPSLVVVVDSDAVIVDSGVDEARAGVNNAFRSALGWHDSALVRRSVLDFIDPSDSYPALMAIASAANGVPAPERESHWLCADGRRLVVAWTATPVDDVTGRKASLVLLSGVDVTDRKQQEEEIRASRTRIVAAADEARRKLERNLHDGAQQRLVALSVTLRLAEGKLESDPGDARVILSAAREELAAALDELRELARGIHPAVLTDRGLRAAVEAAVTRFPLPVDVELPEERLPPPVEAAAYYVISEALANVVKYAQASTVRVRVSEHDDQVTVEVFDDGVGGADAASGTGLRGLADRVAALDGALLLESPVGEGTLVIAVLPARREAVTVEAESAGIRPAPQGAP
jgi:PAS domain S-box-containing protein